MGRQTPYRDNSTLTRLLRGCLLIVAMLGFGAVVCGVAIFAVSGGEPGRFITTAIIRIRLSMREDELNRAMSADTTPVRFTIADGDTPRVIGTNLETRGLISDDALFVDYTRVNGIDVELEAGVYFLTPAQTIAEIAQALTDSASSQFAFRILEGWRMEEIAAAIDSSPYFGFTGDDFLSAVEAGAPQDAAFAGVVGLPAGASLEGFLFPDTYQLPATVTPVMLRDILTRRFLEIVGGEVIPAARTQNLSLYEVVTLASIIEREALFADEYPRIASVYRNRLDAGMKLDADPTVQYGIGFKDDTWWPQITQADYTGVSSPYNTYLINGLPPGPIANPGAGAIRAAVQPEETPYFYFRARCEQDGYHNFAVTYEEQLANACE